MLTYTGNRPQVSTSGLEKTVQVELGDAAICRLEEQAERSGIKLASHLRAIWALALACDGELAPSPIQDRKMGVRVVSVGVSAEMFGQIEAIRGEGSRSGFLRALTRLGADAFDASRPAVSSE